MADEATTTTDRLVQRESSGIDEQRIRVLLAHLIDEGTDPEAIKRAVSRAIDVQLGEAISESALTQAFVREQVGRLERGVY